MLAVIQSPRGFYIRFVRSEKLPDLRAWHGTLSPPHILLMYCWWNNHEVTVWLSWHAALNGVCFQKEMKYG